MSLRPGRHLGWGQRVTSPSAPPNTILLSPSFSAGHLLWIPSFCAFFSSGSQRSSPPSFPHPTYCMQSPTCNSKNTQESLPREAGGLNCRSSLLTLLLWIQPSTLIPRSAAEYFLQPPLLLPYLISSVSQRSSLPKPPPFHSLLYPSFQVQEALPGNLRTLLPGRQVS